MTKLTLSVDEKVVAEAKRIARRRNTSVSAMFANLVRGMAAHETDAGARPTSRGRPAPLTARALRLVRQPARGTPEALRQDALFAKYGPHR